MMHFFWIAFLVWAIGFTALTAIWGFCFIYYKEYKDPDAEILFSILIGASFAWPVSSALILIEYLRRKK